MNVMKCIGFCCVSAAFSLWSTTIVGKDGLALKTQQQDLAWQQVDAVPSLTVFSERDIYTSLDREGRIVFAVQVGRPPQYKQEDLSVTWTIKRAPQKASVTRNTGSQASLEDAEKGENKETTDLEDELLGTLEPTLAQGVLSLSKGMGLVTFDVTGMVPGEYSVQATFCEARKTVADKTISFLKQERATPAQHGKIPIIFPQGIPGKGGTYPVSCGIPFPKGALWRKENVRLETTDGKPVPCQVAVRSRWGSSKASSIRWLGLDFQAAPESSWRQTRQASQYVLSYGPTVKPIQVPDPVKVVDQTDMLTVDTGPLQVSIRKRGFNLFDKVVLNGATFIGKGGNAGLYLVDHQDNIYRAANDMSSSVSIEEQGPLRSVIRVEGWYVKDGTNGKQQRYTLPTDKLCKYVTRLEFYAGKSYVRVLSTWIVTFDIFSVKLKDLGIDIPVSRVNFATFGIEDAKPFRCETGTKGVYLVQHLYDKFDIEADGHKLKDGTHCDGWFSATNATAATTVALRAAWQRYPKEFEVLPDRMKVHIWPAHGKTHPDIDALSHQNLPRLLYAHEGREMALAMPWNYYLAAAKILGTDKTGVYSATGQVLAGVHSGALGCAITSDIMVDFSSAQKQAEAVEVCESFKANPHAMAPPSWNCASGAVGWIHPYDKKRFPVMEQVIEDAVKGYEKTNDVTREYGMWIYRRWHHSDYLGDKKWDLYRLNNTTHHYEAFMPWLFYLRSGDPFYLKQGHDHTRSLADVGIVHYEDVTYPQKEFHFHQKRLLGSTKHTNGFVPWGGDHAIGAHLTCYNGLMLAYYLTGDLRYKEVVVDEWERTITERRDNPEYSQADRSREPDGSIKGGQKTGARDVDCFIGELIDLYRLTYSPKVLALLGQRIPVMENNPITDWGMPLQNVLQFYGSRKLRKDLAALADEFSRTGTKPAHDPHLFWYYGGASHMPITLAAITGKNKNYAGAAYYLAAPYNQIGWSSKIRDQVPGPQFCMVPDVVLKYPHLMHACAVTGCDTSNIAMSQPMPVADNKQNGWTRCMIKEAADQEITLKFSGFMVEDIPVVVLGPDQQRILATRVRSQLSERKPIVIGKDGKTGVYTVFIKAKDTKSTLRVPISDLPEVYCLKYWAQATPGRFFINGIGDDRHLDFTPHKSSATLVSAAGDKVLAETRTGEKLAIEIPAEGAWLSSKARYNHPVPIAILSVSPQRWFAPPKDALKQKTP